MELWVLSLTFSTGRSAIDSDILSDASLAQQKNDNLFPHDIAVFGACKLCACLRQLHVHGWLFAWHLAKAAQVDKIRRKQGIH